MVNVDEYYKQLELTQSVDVRRVYLASDDPTVIKEAIARYVLFSHGCRKLLFFRYPNYTFFGDAEVAKIAALDTRYTINSLFGIITDIHFLSLTDYLVCTFSSQVGRFSPISSYRSIYHYVVKKRRHNPRIKYTTFQTFFVYNLDIVLVILRKNLPSIYFISQRVVLFCNLSSVSISKNSLS
jgi:Alpha-(1,6)-fucosyltransferase N- and catalytic domains